MIGLIPAHAGKTAFSSQSVFREGAHPRSRGENGFADLRGGGVRGSSPLTRGKLAAVNPTFATVLAHPRSRGENQVGAGFRRLRAGSSPLTRGKPICGFITLQLKGLIPAHAGKTQSPPSPCTAMRAHPRSRGENHLPPYRGAKLSGSSPLTRGKHR